MHFTIHTQLLQCFILSTILSQTMASICLTKRYAVHIVNNLPQDNPPLLVHCKSGNQDKGFLNLTTNQDYNFKFCINFGTLYFCNLWWNGKHIVYNAYTNGWAFKHCSDYACYWAAKADGIYYSNHYPPTDLIKQFDW